MEDKKVFLHLDKVKSSAHIESIVDEKNVLKAGQFVDLTVIDEENGGEIFKFEKSKPKAKVDGLVVPVHKDYGYADFDEAIQTVRKGEAARVYIIEKGNIISFHKDMMGAVKVGDKLAIGKDGFALEKTESDEEKVAVAVAEREINNVGEVIAVRFV